MAANSMIPLNEVSSLDKLSTIVPAARNVFGFPSGHSYFHQPGSSAQPHLWTIQPHLAMHTQSSLPMQPHPNSFQMYATDHLGHQPINAQAALPFVDLTKARVIAERGVMKIGNCPYSVTKQEIIQFVGRDARIIPSNLGCPVHIIMERSTAKTMDCYVEFEALLDAETCVKRLNNVLETGRPPRLGNRHVEVVLSNEDALLHDLFPRAKCVAWKGGQPCVIQNSDPYSSGFKGFLTREELLGVVRHAEQPQRSPFSQKCPQRTYESVISTVWKFPWFATTLFTVEDRDVIFQAINRQVLALTARMKTENVIGLNHTLLLELVRAGCSCPAFNERQRFTLIVNAELNPPEPVLLKKFWPFDTLGKRPGATDAEVMYFAGLIQRAVTISDIGTSKLPNFVAKDPIFQMSPFGAIWLEWSLGDMTVQWEEATRHELALATRLISDGWMLHQKFLQQISEQVCRSPPLEGNVNQGTSQKTDVDNEHSRRRGMALKPPAEQSSPHIPAHPAFSQSAASDASITLYDNYNMQTQMPLVRDVLMSGLVPNGNTGNNPFVGPQPQPPPYGVSQQHIPAWPQ